MSSALLAFFGVAVLLRATPIPPTDNTAAPYMGFYGWNPFTGSGPGWNYGINRGACAASYLYRHNMWSESFCGDTGTTHAAAWASLACPNNVTTGAKNWLIQSGSNGYCVITMALFPQHWGDTYSGCLSGTTAASYYTQAANRLLAAGLANNTIIRLSHEFNGNWYDWKITHRNTDLDGNGNKYDDRPENFVALWQLAVNSMRAVAPNLKFCWNGAVTSTTYNVSDAYPGDAYVDYVGVDAYDQSWGTNTYPYSSSTYPYGSDAATRQQNAWNNWINSTSQNGLPTWKAIANAHGKPLAIPEWGLSDRTNTTKSPDGHGGMDNPYFIQKMYDFIQDPANNVAFHVYFDVNMDDGIHQIISYPSQSSTSFPYASAKFKQLFGIRLPFDTDIGTVGVAGRSDATTVDGAGAGYLNTGTSDNFHFFARTTNGDDQFMAEIVSTSSGTAGQGGVMVRQSMAANAPYAALLLANGKCIFQSRTGTGAAASQNSVINSVNPPAWLKIVRQSGTVTGYQSTDGVNWNYAGSQTLSLTGTNYFGVAVSSGSTTGLNTVKVDNVDNYNFDVAITGTINNRIILDNSDTTGINKTGSWSNYTSPADYSGSDYLWLYHGSPISTITYSPTIATAGRYNVYMRWATDEQRSSNVFTRITAASGTNQLYCNQYTNAFLWNYLGTYNFSSGTTGNIFVSSTNVNGYAATADAVMLVPLPTASLPAPKTDADVGSPAVAGSASYSGGVYTIKGAGTGISVTGTTDQFNFVSQSASGDRTLVARVTGLTYTNFAAKAGVMMRDSLAANSVFAMLDVSPGGWAEFYYRAAPGTTPSYNSAVTGVTPSPTTPVWLKLSKTSTTYNAYYATTIGTPTSADWHLVGSVSLLLAGTYQSGLAVTSAVSSTLATGTFDNVSP